MNRNIKSIISGLFALFVVLLFCGSVNATPFPHWARTVQVIRAKQVPPPPVPVAAVSLVTVGTTPMGNVALTGMTREEIEKNLLAQLMNLQISIMFVPTNTEYYRTTVEKINLLDQIIWMIQHQAPEPSP